MTQQKIISIYLSNHFGSLTKVTTMFSRRGCNIQLLTVCATQTPEYSRITVTVEDEPEKLDQIISQLHKLEDVKDVTELPSENYLERTVALYKLKPGVKPEESLWADTDCFVKEHSLPDGCIALEAMGASGDIDVLTGRLGALGLDKISRPGCAALYLAKDEEYNHVDS